MYIYIVEMSGLNVNCFQQNIFEAGHGFAALSYDKNHGNHNLLIS